MEHMRQIAFATALRACGFGSLAIFCVMIGLSFEPRAAFQAGGFLTTLMAAILIFKDGTNLTIHNYAIYGANIVVLTPERHKYPIAALDVAATEKANEAAGYELKLPAVFTSH